MNILPAFDPCWWMSLTISGSHGVYSEFDRVPGFGLREGVPVTVVVVTHVVVVNLRRRRALGLCPEGGAVPVADDVHAVRILRGDENDDRVREDRACFGRVAASEAVGEHERRGESPGFGRMDRGGDQDDVFPRREQRLELILPAEQRVHELALDHLIAIQVFQRGGVGDENREKRAAERGLAERMDLYAWARLLYGVEVVGDLLPRGKVAVGAGFIAEDGRGGRHRGLLCGERGGGDSRGDCEVEEFHKPKTRTAIRD